MTGRIDTHLHIVPKRYAAWLAERGYTAGGMPIPPWSTEAALDVMDAHGVSAGLLSISTPGVHLGDDAEARVKAREVNEDAAAVVAARPDRFGFFATLTLPDLDGALAEAAYAFDTLKADGVVLPTSVHNQYLGDPAWDTLMAELNRRNAVIFTHPGGLEGPHAPGLNPHVCDFLLDTVRAAVSICKAEYFTRFPNLRFILSHGGGFVPFAAQRLARDCSPDRDNDHGIENLRRFYFDTALASSPFGMPSLLALADSSRITFGSDWPYAPKDRGIMFTQMLDEFSMDAGLRRAIDRDNAAKLFPRFAAGAQT